MQVKVFDEAKAKEELKKCPKIVQDYFKLINKHWDNQKDITNKAIAALREEATKSKALFETCESQTETFNQLMKRYKGLEEELKDARRGGNDTGHY